jgi:hypothetical protein
MAYFGGVGHRYRPKPDLNRPDKAVANLLATQSPDGYIGT